MYGEALKPLSDGGPLQAAIREDLDQLFNQFTSLLAKNGGDDGHSAFGTFKTVFKTNKVALLHLLAPPRCDVAAYSQLIYAVCLSMIHDAFADYLPVSAAFFEHVAYATFLLYTLYQTNPLPTAAQTTSYRTQLELLPLGLLDCRNPKESTFAHHFLAPIRIDYEHYGYLVRLLDLGMAAKDHLEKSYSLIQDLSAVVHRLLSNDMLELCAYTGPCSLEGLLGHEMFDLDDCPFTSIPRSTVDETSVSSPDIVEQIQLYQNLLGIIRVPPMTANMSNRSRRIRSALEPVFSEDSTLAQLLKTTTGGPIEKHKVKTRVKFGPASVQCLEDSDQLAPNICDTQTDEIPKILLPDGLSAAHVESIGHAVRILADRGTPLLPTQRKYSMDASQLLASSASALSNKEPLGKQALAALIMRSRAAEYGMSFLASQTLPHDNHNIVEGGIENFADPIDMMSDLSSDDDLSTAVSRVGQSALQKLLEKAVVGRKKPESNKRPSSEGKPSHPIVKKTRRPQKKLSDDGSQVSRAYIGRNLLDDLISRARGSKTSGNTELHPRKAPKKNGKWESAESAPSRFFPMTESTTDHSMQNCSSESHFEDVGHNSLRKLIYQARPVQTDHDQHEQKVIKVTDVLGLQRLGRGDGCQSTESIGSESRQSNLGQNAIDTLLKKARYR